MTFLLLTVDNASKRDAIFSTKMARNAHVHDQANLPLILMFV